MGISEARLRKWLLSMSALLRASNGELKPERAPHALPCSALFCSVLLRFALLCLGSARGRYDPPCEAGDALRAMGAGARQVRWVLRCSYGAPTWSASSRAWSHARSATCAPPHRAAPPLQPHRATSLRGRFRCECSAHKARTGWLAAVHARLEPRLPGLAAALGRPAMAGCPSHAALIPQAGVMPMEYHIISHICKRGSVAGASTRAAARCRGCRAGSAATASTAHACTTGSPPPIRATARCARRSGALSPPERRIASHSSRQVQAMHRSRCDGVGGLVGGDAAGAANGSAAAAPHHRRPLGRWAGLQLAGHWIDPSMHR